jgi:hypothetical protein
MVPSAGGEDGGHGKQRRGPGHHPQPGQPGHREHEHALVSREPDADDDRDDRGGQPGRERDRRDHDGLGGQDAAAPGGRGQGCADQAAPVLGGHEHRPDDDDHDQPGERAHEVILDGPAVAAAPSPGHLRGNVPGPGDGEASARSMPGLKIVAPMTR